MVLSLVRVRDRPFLLKGVGDELLLLEGEGGKLELDQPMCVIAPSVDPKQ